MDILEPVCVVLSTIAKAIQVTQQNRNARGEEWKPERAFCVSLRSTLEGIRDRSPSNNANFTHAQDLKRLTQAVHQPLAYFYNVLTPSYPSLQNACEPYATQETLARLEVQLRQSVIPPVQALRQQVSIYLQGINTLLLLYTIDIYSNRSNEVVSEQQLVELQNSRRRAGAVALPDLDQLAKLFSTRRLTAAEQQRRLASMRRDVERHWQGVQLAIQGNRSEVPDNFDDSSYKVQGAMHKNSNQVAGVGGLGAQQQVRPPQTASRPATGSPAHRPSPPAHTQGSGPTSNGPKKSRPGNGNTSTPKPRPQALPPGRASPARKQVGTTGHQPLPQSTKNHGSQPRPASNPPPQKVVQSKPPAVRAQAPPPQHAPYRGQRKSQAPSTGPGRKATPQSGGHNTVRQAPNITTNNYHTTSNSNSSYNVERSAYSYNNSSSFEMQQVDMQQSNAYLQQQNFPDYEGDQPWNRREQSADDDDDERHHGNQDRPGYQDTQDYPGHHGYPDAQDYPGRRDYPNTQGYPGHQDYPDTQGYQGYPQQDTPWQPQPHMGTPQPTNHREQGDDDDYDGRYHGNQDRPDYQDTQEHPGHQDTREYPGLQGYPETQDYPAHQGHPDTQEYPGYPQQDTSWQPQQQQPQPQPYVETPQPTYHPDNQSSRGYAPQEPMRPSSDYGKNKSHSTAAYVGAGVAGGAALGVGAAVAYGASGDGGSTNGSADGSEDGCCEGGCCEGECCEGGCCEGGCCDGGCCEGGCCDDGCCEGGCCEGDCCGGGCLSGCCGDDDGEENDSCCIIM